MKNCFKYNDNLNTVTVFSSIEGITTHLANIDKRTNRIYTTKSAYEFLATPEFKVNHPVEWFEEEKDTPYRKFNVAVRFYADELLTVLHMCSRELVF